MTDVSIASTTPWPSSVSNASPGARRRLAALVVIAAAQLMIVLDASVVIVALPSAQHALHISTADRQWVMTAYSLAFGSLLLLGGRIADFVGRKRTFMASLIGFATASALGGLAPSAGMLFGARALQGAFAALMAPSALSLLTVTFTEPRERARAFGVYGAVAGSGAAIGLVLGGTLTQFASWRWTLLINVPIALVAAFAASRVVGESRAAGRRSYDIPGALAVTLGLLLLVYGFTLAGSDGWGAPGTLGLFASAAAALAGFVALERRTAHPLLPIAVVTDRNRGGAYVASLLVGSAMLGTFLFLTYFFQGTLHYSALGTGFAFLPFSAGIVVGAGLSSRLLPATGPRLPMSLGLVLAAAGLGWFTQLGVHSSYAAHVLPAEVVVSLGMGLAFVPMSSTALVGVDPTHAGVASALVNATQQVGGSLGTALLNTVAASAAASFLAAHENRVSLAQVAAVHGYTTAFALSTGLLGVALLTTLTLVRAGTPQTGPTLGAEPSPDVELAPEPVG